MQKRTISYILNHADDELVGHHSLGVNSLQYDSKRDVLVSAGRDGVVSIWQGEDSGASDEDSRPSEEESSDLVRQQIAEYLDDEAGLTALEAEIVGHKLQTSTQKRQYTLKTFSHLHLDWINDAKVLDSASLTVACCSNDLSVKLWSADTNKQTTLGYHNDYVKCLARSGDSLFSGGLDRDVKMWDVARQTCVDSFHFEDDKASVYTMDGRDHLVICGGPTGVICLFDSRDLRKPVKRFLGHTDIVRCLRMGDKSFLSGSSDTTVRLWDLRTNRTMRNFDMHESAVWSLHVPEDFGTFYSGDRNGVVVKTDLRASDLNPESEKRDYFNDKVNSSLGVSTVVADLCSEDDPSQNHGVLSICSGHGNTIWTASAVSKDSFMCQWSVPDTTDLVVHQGVRLYRNLRLFGDRKEDPLAADGSVASVTTLQPVGSTAFSLTSLSNNDTSLDLVSQFSHDDMNQIDEALTSQILLNGNGTNNKSDDSLVDGSQEDTTYFLSHTDGTDSEYVVDENGTLWLGHGPTAHVTVVPFNAAPLQSIEGSNGLVRSRMLNNRRHVATMDQKGCIYVIDIVSGKLVRKIDNTDKMLDSLHMADRFQDITDSLQTEETLPQWCSVQTKGGMLFITLQESTFTNCEVYADELYEAYGDSVDPNSEVRCSLGKIVLRSLLDAFVVESTSAARVSVRKKERNSTANGAAARQATSSAAKSAKKGLFNHKKESKKRMFSFRHHGGSESSASATIPASGNSAQITPVLPVSADTAKTTKELLEWMDNTSSADPEPEDADLPKFKLDSKIMLTVNENIRSYGDDTKTLFLTHLGELAASTQTLEDLLPVWVSRAVLLGKYPQKSVPKIGFMLTPDPSSVPQLSTLESNKLTAHALLRMSKIAEYVQERLPEGQKEHELELLCKDHVLDGKMTLNTLKTRKWKSSNDVDILFRVKAK